MIKYTVEGKSMCGAADTPTPPPPPSHTAHDVRSHHLFTPPIHTAHAHRLFTPSIHTACSHTPSMRIAHSHRPCTPPVYTVNAQSLFTPSMHTALSGKSARCAGRAPPSSTLTTHTALSHSPFSISSRAIRTERLSSSAATGARSGWTGTDQSTPHPFDFTAAYMNVGNRRLRTHSTSPPPI